MASNNSDSLRGLTGTSHKECCNSTSTRCGNTTGTSTVPEHQWDNTRNETYTVGQAYSCWGRNHMSRYGRHRCTHGMTGRDSTDPCTTAGVKRRLKKTAEGNVRAQPRSHQQQCLVRTAAW